MTRMTMFDNPLFLGFENLERTLDRIAKSSAEVYPPYNIEQLRPNISQPAVHVARDHNGPPRLWVVAKSCEGIE